MNKCRIDANISIAFTYQTNIILGTDASKLKKWWDFPPCLSKVNWHVAFEWCKRKEPNNLVKKTHNFCFLCPLPGDAPPVSTVSHHRNELATRDTLVIAAASHSPSIMKSAHINCSIMNRRHNGSHISTEICTFLENMNARCGKIQNQAFTGKAFLCPLYKIC